MAKRKNELEKLVIAGIISTLFLVGKMGAKNLSRYSTGFIIYIIISTFLFILGCAAYSANKSEAVVFLIVVFIITTIFYLIIANKKQKKLMALSIERKNIIDRIIQKHIDTLKIKYSQLVYYDDYGIIKDRKFMKELDYFIDNVICAEIRITNEERRKIITNIYSQCQRNNIQTTQNKSNPYDFETNCAQILKNSGWEAVATQKSGDMGVDVIATKNNIKIVIQCKLYSKPVGNKAVQEIVAGKDYYKADYAAVVSNNTYTVAARQLAKNCDVLLLSYDDLKDLDKILHI